MPLGVTNSISVRRNPRRAPYLAWRGQSDFRRFSLDLIYSSVNRNCRYATVLSRRSLGIGGYVIDGADLADR